MSASAPAGSAKKNTGKLVAACTSATISGEGASVVMSQLAPTSCSRCRYWRRLSRPRERETGDVAAAPTQMGVGSYTRHARPNADAKSPRHACLEREAIAAEGTPKRVRGGVIILPRRMRTRVMREGCAPCRDDLTTIAAVVFDRRPVGAHWQRRRIEVLELGCCINRLAADEGQHRFELFDALLRHRKIILGKHGQIRELPRCDSTFLPIFP